MQAVVITDTSRRAFVRHSFEMLAAMVAGMAVLGAAVSLLFALLNCSGLLEHADLHAMIMATNMTVGMAVWMHYRGHSWTHIGEMAAAMYVPFLVLLAPYWANLLRDGGLLVGGHVLMLPSMLGVMLYRRDVYARDHRQHATEHVHHVPNA